ncbi:putative membrane protein YfcA [Sphingobium xenophagum]|uniref:Probable membrane transporter protein n=1 Tax=Sphingobium xenophagum TaxID=121428 RepID=A0ABU1WZL7_SPHXE|nr:sulfite exporter TauE/SafE family protein [Sphingobium xenophagum]MDR7154753.1 putative membrane protein YfcA [Sphingobium xenophagum]
MIDVFALSWSDLAPFILVGFLAQLVDGTIGMAFGVLSTNLLLAFGLPPAAAATASRTAESFASGVSGLSQAINGNIDWSLFSRMVIPGCLGGFVGVWLLTSISFNVARPVVLTYLAAVGIYLIWRGQRRPHAFRRMRMVSPLAFLGGCLDSSGSGGWGPIVTGSLIAQGATPRTAIGTANAAEFFVTITVLAGFIGTLGIQAITMAVSGLMIGSIVAAPLGAYLAKRIPSKLLILMIGFALLIISLYGLVSLIIAPIPVFPRF